MNHAWAENMVACHPPSLPFVEDRIRTTYRFDAGEKELKEIVTDQKNYTLREDVKALKRRLMFAKRREIPDITTELQTKFEQMISNVETEKVIADFPSKGASAVVSSSQEGMIKIDMDNLIQEDLEFIPVETRKKLGKTVSIHYKYPYDSFDYYVNYEGQEQPLTKALHKMLDEFQTACLIQMKDNEIKSRGEQRVNRQ